MMKVFQTLSGDLLSLFFPHLCLACCRQNAPARELLCLSCQLKLPCTHFHQEAENDFTQRFWGRVPISSGAALYHFIKGGRAQKLIHQLKYAGKQRVGRELGRHYGRQLSQSPHFEGVELIVPVPLQPRKRHSRGFNQSACFAAGLSESMGVPWREEVLIRNSYTVTQTKKSRLERMENVLNAFQLARPELVRNRHVLLVDDVLTTGATLEACGGCLLKAEKVKLSMATIGIAQI